MRNFLLLVLFVLGFIVSACGSEEYQCDETGCYQCDGAGCRLVEPPARNTCQGDFDCVDGRLCTENLGCVDSCEEDQDCVLGTLCREGFCLAPQEETPIFKPGVCETKADCKSDGLICKAGKCVLDDSCGGQSCDCLEHGSCASGFECLAGECQAEEDICHFSYECQGQSCVDGRCVGTCESARDCLADQVCDEGFCKKDPTLHECGGEISCGSNEVCVNEQCVQTCHENASCEDGFYCKAGLCEVDDRAKPFCHSNNECEFVCSGGICRTPCESHDECLRIDSQFAFCSEGFCKTKNEVVSNCELSRDCRAGQQCVDGQCR